MHIKYKILISVIIITLSISQSAISQDAPSSNVVLIAAGGLQESLSASVGIPVTDYFLAGIKINRIVTGGGRNRVIYKGYGLGINTSYRFSNETSFFNVANLEISYLYHILEVKSPSNGYNYQVTLGNRSESVGIHFFWGVGIGVTTFSNSTSYILPVLQLGAQWNL